MAVQLERHSFCYIFVAEWTYLDVTQLKRSFFRLARLKNSKESFKSRLTTRKCAYNLLISELEYENFQIAVILGWRAFLAASLQTYSVPINIPFKDWWTVLLITYLGNITIETLFTIAKNFRNKLEEVNKDAINES